MLDPLKAQLPLRWAGRQGTVTVLDVPSPRGKRILLTAAHCCDGSSSGHVVVDGRLVPAVLLARDRDADLAVLEADLPGFRYACRLSGRRLGARAQIFQGGFGGRRASRVQFGLSLDS